MKHFGAIISLLMLLSCNVLATGDYFYLRVRSEEKIKVTTQELETLPLQTISTSTNFTNKCNFSGVKFSDLFAKYHISGAGVRVFAWDDYSYSIPVNELLKYNVILAYKKNGKYIAMSDLGPYAIIYPRDDNPELKSLDVNARTVWQIKEIKVN